MSVADGLPQPGEHVRMELGGTAVEVGELLGEGGQAVVRKAVLPNGNLFALKWYKPDVATEKQRATVRTLVVSENKKPHRAFVWPLDLLDSDTTSGFGYLMPLMEPRFRPIAELVKAPERTGFRAVAAIGHDLADAFAKLHGAGWCYRDINSRNIFADPDQGEVAIVDCDNIGLDNGHISVLGTARYMAPEIVRGEATPCAATDLYSLAVMLFFLCMKDHPLVGRRVEASYTWEAQHQDDTALARRHYGLDPLFVFDPTDSANRPSDGSAVPVWWSIYPSFLRTLFTTAFTVGLRETSAQARITAQLWREAMLRMRDLVSVCERCNAAVFYDHDAPDAPCWRCASVPPTPFVLRIDGLRSRWGKSGLVLTDGARLTAHHLLANSDHRGLAGRIEANTGEPLTLRNLTKRDWAVRPVGEDDVRTVAPGRRMAARPMEIDFGTAKGRITVG